MSAAMKIIDSDAWGELLQHQRVLVYTEGVDFAGEQFFDVKTEDLILPMGDEDERPEACRFATHWMPLPHPAR